MIAVFPFSMRGLPLMAKTFKFITSKESLTFLFYAAGHILSVVDSIIEKT
jgi:hypothetical protein